MLGGPHVARGPNVAQACFRLSFFYPPVFVLAETPVCNYFYLYQRFLSDKLFSHFFLLYFRGILTSRLACQTLSLIDEIGKWLTLHFQNVKKVVFKNRLYFQKGFQKGFQTNTY
jgi:hypothetical protein